MEAYMETIASLQSGSQDYTSSNAHSISKCENSR